MHTPLLHYPEEGFREDSLVNQIYSAVVEHRIQWAGWWSLSLSLSRVL